MLSALCAAAFRKEYLIPVKHHMDRKNILSLCCLAKCLTDHIIHFVSVACIKVCNGNQLLVQNLLRPFHRRHRKVHALLDCLAVKIPVLRKLLPVLCVFYAVFRILCVFGSI